jgi:hypothetical protein
MLAEAAGQALVVGVGQKQGARFFFSGSVVAPPSYETPTPTTKQYYVSVKRKGAAL